MVVRSACDSYLVGRTLDPKAKLEFTRRGAGPCLCYSPFGKCARCLCCCWCSCCSAREITHATFGIHPKTHRLRSSTAVGSLPVPMSALATRLPRVRCLCLPSLLSGTAFCRKCVLRLICYLLFPVEERQKDEATKLRGRETDQTPPRIFYSRPAPKTGPIPCAAAAGHQ